MPPKYHGYEKQYVSPEELSDVLTVREKAERHLKTWSKKRLATQLLNSASDGWLGKWADEYGASQEER